MRNGPDALCAPARFLAMAGCNYFFFGGKYFFSIEATTT